MRIVELMSALQQGREERRKLLTRGERILAWSLTAAPTLLTIGGLVLLMLGKGTGHALAIGLLIAALFATAVPASPFLQARRRRRRSEATRRS
jgi:hypothetical protein